MIKNLIVLPRNISSVFASLMDFQLCNCFLAWHQLVRLKYVVKNDEFHAAKIIAWNYCYPRSLNQSVVRFFSFHLWMLEIILQLNKMMKSFFCNSGNWRNSSDKNISNILNTRLILGRPSLIGGSSTKFSTFLSRTKHESKLDGCLWLWCLCLSLY